MFKIFKNVRMSVISNCCASNLAIKTVFVCFLASVVLLLVQIETLQYFAGFKTKPSLLVDNTTYSVDDLLAQSQKLAPNFPISFWRGIKTSKVNGSCAWFPKLINLKFNNVYWQTLQDSNVTLHFFGAYKDARDHDPLGPSVRILTMMTRKPPKRKFFCQFWFKDKMKAVPVQDYMLIAFAPWKSPKLCDPYFLTCKIPPEFHNRTPEAVSVVQRPCETATNLLKVVYNPAEVKKDVAVCVKGLSFAEDISARLVEWIELVKLLGADKIFFYKLGIHPNTSKVLEYYERRGEVETTPITLVGDLPNLPFLQQYFLEQHIPQKRRNELVPYHDCFYKHMYRYNFIVLLDIDEVIVPLSTNSWKDLLDAQMNDTKNHGAGAFAITNVYFLDSFLNDFGEFPGIPPYMHMMQHVFRAKNFTKPSAYIKAFFKTDSVVVLHNHMPRVCFRKCNSRWIDVKHAQLQHYRQTCRPELKCDTYKDYMMDSNLWRFKEEMIERVTRTLRHLGFLVSHF